MSPSRSTLRNPGQGSKVKLFDDFLGPALDASKWVTRLGTAPPPAPSLDSTGGGLRGGSYRLTTGNSATGTMAVNGVQIDSFKNWHPARGGLSFESRVAFGNAITNVVAFAGFTNQNTALEMPFSMAAGDVLTAIAADAVGFLFDTRADTDNWWAVGSASSVAVKSNLGIAPVLDTAQILRVDVSRTGIASFWSNGRLIVPALSAAVGSAIDLTPLIAIFATGASTRSIYFDYILCEVVRTMP